jgi:broad specificity phosphatase PhoE
LSTLILVRHAAPEIKPDIPASAWPLSPASYAEARALAVRLAGYEPGILASSPEQKAIETAQAMAEVFRLSVTIDNQLAEHSRKNIGFLPRDDFDSAMARFFAEPTRRVFGDESGDEAHGRFAAATIRHCDATAAGSIVVVAHGTVIALVVARRFGLDAPTCWRRIGLPCAVVIRPSAQQPEYIE